MFKSELHSKMLKNEKHELLQPLVFESLIGEIIVPKGFVTDFASVPRIPIVYALTGNTSHRAAVVHDYLYGDNGLRVSRKKADKVFLEAMKSRKVSGWRRYSMYWAVRLFGSNRYKNQL